MTELFILSQLYAKQRDKRAALVKITENALTSAAVKDEMSDTLGYSVETLSRWVIVRGPHKSTKKDQNHITVRGYSGGEHAITAHLYLDVNNQFERHVAFTKGRLINADVTCVRSHLY
ncbi:hypothetical protein EYR36_003594 [Pleurotus pulmonarius]|nr:hypothetical protein EYR36_003594 [Pleurotus pulmonarius]